MFLTCNRGTAHPRHFQDVLAPVIHELACRFECTVDVQELGQIVGSAPLDSGLSGTT